MTYEKENSKLSYYSKTEKSIETCINDIAGP